ncbi:MAG TPA: hypothetical protein PLJ47_12820 [Candidatus Hydrogenedentes bacterium]|nr:hypothetical protein [Candidatus Hydrogenedentota bacterium]
MNAISNLPTGHLDLVEKSLHRPRALFVPQLGRIRPRHYHHVGVFAKLGAVLPVELAQIPLYAVARDCRANLARHSESKLPTLTFPPKQVTDERRPHALAALLEDRDKIPLARETLILWKRL